MFTSYLIAAFWQPDFHCITDSLKLINLTNYAVTQILSVSVYVSIKLKYVMTTTVKQKNIIK